MCSQLPQLDKVIQKSPPPFLSPHIDYWVYLHIWIAGRDRNRKDRYWFDTQQARLITQQRAEYLTKYFRYSSKRPMHNSLKSFCCEYQKYPQGRPHSIASCPWSDLHIYLMKGMNFCSWLNTIWLEEGTQTWPFQNTALEKVNKRLSTVSLKHTIIKLSKVKKQKFLKQPNICITYRRTLNSVWIDFSTEPFQITKVEWYVQPLREKYLQPGIFYMPEVFIKNKEEINIFLDKQKLKKFIIKLDLQKMVKKNFQTETKGH